MGVGDGRAVGQCQAALRGLPPTKGRSNLALSNSSTGPCRVVVPQYPHITKLCSVAEAVRVPEMVAHSGVTPGT
jgi:hypothetical protein